MRNSTLLALLGLFLFTVPNAYAQNNKILKAKYKLLPLSQYYFNHNETTSAEKKEFDIALRSGYAHEYTFLLDLKTNRSLFVFDTLIVTKVKGKESYWTDPENKLKYCLKNSNGTYIRKEQVFDQSFYINGNKNDIAWEITNETKKILGFECTKAVSKNKKFLYTVWFTKEIPVSAGPANFVGLPGLVLWAEDYFSTISAEKISYLENDGSFDKKFEKLKEQHEENHEKNGISERIYLLKKSSLVTQIRGR